MDSSSPHGGDRALDRPTDPPRELPDRPPPCEVAEALEPVPDRQPPARLGGGLRTR